MFPSEFLRFFASRILWWRRQKIKWRIWVGKENVDRVYAKTSRRTMKLPCAHIGVLFDSAHKFQLSFCVPPANVRCETCTNMNACTFLNIDESTKQKQHTVYRPECKSSFVVSIACRMCYKVNRWEFAILSAIAIGKFHILNCIVNWSIKIYGKYVWDASKSLRRLFNSLFARSTEKQKQRESDCVDAKIIRKCRPPNTGIWNHEWSPLHRSLPSVWDERSCEDFLFQLLVFPNFVLDSPSYVYFACHMRLSQIENCYRTTHDVVYFIN